MKKKKDDELDFVGTVTTLLFSTEKKDSVNVFGSMLWAPARHFMF